MIQAPARRGFAAQGVGGVVAGDLVAVDRGDDEHGRPVAAGVVGFAHVDGRCLLRAAGQEVVALGSAGKRGAQRDEYEKQQARKPHPQGAAAALQGAWNGASSPVHRYAPAFKRCAAACPAARPAARQAVSR